MSGLEVLKQVSVRLPPVIVYTGQELTKEEEQALNEFSSDIIIKGAESPERLLDDVSLFLHSIESKLPNEQKKTVQMLHDQDAILRQT